MKTVKFTLANDRGQHGTDNTIYADGTQSHFGDGRDGDARYAPKNLSRSPQVGQSVTFRGQSVEGRAIIGTITRAEHLTTGAIAVEIDIA